MRENFIRPKQLGLLEDHSDGLVNIADIRKGDVFYECHHTWGNIRVTALQDAERKNDGWACWVKDSSGANYELFASANTLHHGPDLFVQPQIIDQNDRGELGYFVR